MFKSKINKYTNTHTCNLYELLDCKGEREKKEKERVNGER